MEGIRIDVSLCLTIFLCPGPALQHQDPPIRLGGAKESVHLVYTKGLPKARTKQAPVHVARLDYLACRHRGEKKSDHRASKSSRWRHGGGCGVRGGGGTLSSGQCTNERCTGYPTTIPNTDYLSFGCGSPVKRARRSISPQGTIVDDLFTSKKN
nr:hypothetical protein Iba_chr13cCG14020 [Ipomoea batatas]